LAPRTGGGYLFAAFLAVVSVLVLAVIQPVGVANPDWRKVASLGAVMVVVWGMAAAYALGGLPWLRHFAFPILFFLAAIPWTRGMEDIVTNALKPFNAAFAVEVLNWWGFPAHQEGQVIHLSTGPVGVEDGCSGLRSLQSSMVAALFIGEFMRLTWLKRGILLVCGLGIAAVGNLFRTLWLSFAAATGGSASVDNWHDPAGIVILVITSLLLAFMARAMDKPLPPLDPELVNGLGRVMPGYRRWAGICAVTLGILLVSLLGTEAWFHAHEVGTKPVAEWGIRQRAEDGRAKETKIPEYQLVVLNHPKGFSETWFDERGIRWHSYYLRWLPSQTKVHGMNDHHPEKCLTVAGMDLVEKYEPVEVERGDLKIRFNAFQFSNRGMPFYVFHAVMQDHLNKEGTAQPLVDQLPPGRLGSLMAGRRFRGQRVIEYSALGADSFEQARDGFLAALQEDLYIEGEGEGEDR